MTNLKKKSELTFKICGIEIVPLNLNRNKSKIWSKFINHLVTRLFYCQKQLYRKFCFKVQLTYYKTHREQLSPSKEYDDFKSLKTEKNFINQLTS